MAPLSARVATAPVANRALPLPVAAGPRCLLGDVVRGGAEHRPPPRPGACAAVHAGSCSRPASGVTGQCGRRELRAEEGAFRRVPLKAGARLRRRHEEESGGAGERTEGTGAFLPAPPPAFSSARPWLAFLPVAALRGAERAHLGWGGSPV